MAEIARRQHGVIAFEQMSAVGLSSSAISRRVGAGRLHRLHQGVYAVGHVGLSQHGTWLAAVLACGGGGAGEGRRAQAASAGTPGDEVDRWTTVLGHWGAALSHRSAVSLWRLLPPHDGPVDISVSTYGGRARRSGIRLHRSISLLPARVTLRDGIPVTTPARTIADLRRASSGGLRMISPKELRRAIRQADVLGLPVDAADGLGGTRSDLEGDFLRLCRRYRLPAPEVNVLVGPHLVDFLWRDRLVAVETDSYLYHRGRTAFQDDRARDLELRARGFQVIRISEKQVEEEAARVAEVLRRALRVGADARAR